MTKLLYFDDSYRFTSEAAVMAVQQTEDGRTSIQLDQTIFYPQGGGQPYDQGEITTHAARFVVEEARFFDDAVHHIGHFASGSFSTGESVQLQIDEERRRLHARLHSGGHLIDEALRAIGLTDLVPDKGFHYPDGPYVQYQGLIDPKQYEATRESLEKKLKEMIQAGGPVHKEMEEGIHESGKPNRTVQMGGGEAWPCGGTHVQDISEIGPVTIRKVKSKKGVTKIAYALV